MSLPEAITSSSDRNPHLELQQPTDSDDSAASDVTMFCYLHSDPEQLLLQLIKNVGLRAIFSVF